MFLILAHISPEFGTQKTQEQDGTGTAAQAAVGVFAVHSPCSRQ
jgi:hypothetical protein